MNNAKPAIAEVCFSNSWGGLEHYCGDSIIRLNQRGYKVLAVVPPDSSLGNYLSKSGCETIPMRAYRYFSPLTTLKLAGLFKRNNVKALHLHRTHDLGVALPAAIIAGVKSRVFTLQMESDRRKQDIYHRWIYGKLTKVLTITERMRQLVIDNVAVDPAKVECLYYGIDTEGIRAEIVSKSEIRRQWNIPEDAFVIGIVGRLERINKGQDSVIQAAELLTDKIPNLAVMIVGDESIGQSGELRELQRMSDRLKGRVQIVFTGYQHPPGEIVPAFDVSVLASLKESFGLVVIEAQALGVPVIGTNAGGVPEIITDGVNGLLVPPRDANALANAIERIYTDSEFRRSIANAGQKNADTRFSLGTHIKGLEAALMSL